ncbi:MAG: efflux RND transporter periplasmic adaptor subunit [Moraxellaceae bacterium]|nr:efflux RND transporter periplasmic adaptor subunit [Moraxellaceae bacterium]MDZ4297280.1 efflux RND transporter periplasmic adaptor subunit [Moraxellaceae bacterium]MDZ4387845.1 efflux RND transporter periplasmic adaptor subunit [Moraxellaceae bacterium]
MPMTYRIPLLMLTCSLLFACTEAPQSEQDDSIPVRISRIGTQDDVSHINVTGTLASQEEIRLSFKTGGIVRRITVEAGDRVKAGQELARLDTTELDAQVKQASANVDKAKRDLTRAQDLFQQGVIAEQVAQDARTQLSVAEAALSSARFNQQHAVIRASGHGVILQRFAEPGELVAPGSPIVTLARQDLGWVIRAGLGERDAINVDVGNPAEIRLRSYPDLVINSKVREIGSASDPRSGTIRITLPLPPLTEYRLLSGQVADVRIALAAKDNEHIQVPLTAILEGDQDQAYVYVIDKDNVARQRTVKLGDIKDGFVTINDGLRHGEKLVTEGAAWLNPDSRVRILP